MQHHAFRFDPVRPLREHYETVAADTIQLLWRRKRLIATILLGALMLAAAVALLLPKRYTGEALIQLDFSRGDATRPRQPAAAMEASSLVETEARIIRSQIIARRVVARLNLAQDPAMRGNSVLQGIVTWLTSWVSHDGAAAEPSVAAIAVRLSRGLVVTNDTRSYLINIAYTSGSPTQSAIFANAFAEEYIRSSTETVAQREVTDLTSALGAKHPSVLQAESRLNSAAGAIRSQANAYLLANAEAVDVPSGPNQTAIIGLAGAGALALAIALVMMLERRNTGFLTDGQVAFETGIRCLGMIPEIPRAGSARDARAYYEAVRLIVASLGLAPNNNEAKTVLITSALPQEGKSLLAMALTRALMVQGQSALFIDASPCLSGTPPAQSPSLEDVVYRSSAGIELDKPLRDKSVSVLRRSSGLREGQMLLTSPAFANLLANMRKRYGIIVIEAAPTMLSADALLLAHHSDVIIAMLHWNSTPRQAVLTGLRRFDDAGVHVDGIVLSRVDQKEHAARGHVDACFYIRKYADFYESDSASPPHARLSEGEAQARQVPEAATHGGLS